MNWKLLSLSLHIPPVSPKKNFRREAQIPYSYRFAGSPPAPSPASGTQALRGPLSLIAAPYGLSSRLGTRSGRSSRYRSNRSSGAAIAGWRAVREKRP